MFLEFPKNAAATRPIRPATPIPTAAYVIALSTYNNNYKNSMNINIVMMLILAIIIIVSYIHMSTLTISMDTLIHIFIIIHTQKMIQNLRH